MTKIPVTSPGKDRVTLWMIVCLSVAVPGLVAVLYSLPPPTGELPRWAKILPTFNAVLNGSCSLLLFVSLLAIRNGKVRVHKMCNVTAFILSSVFLLSYVTFHSFGVETRFPADHPWRPVYLFILLTHIVLAAGVLPFILLTFYRGLNSQFRAHRKIARWTWPLWFYVTVSGVLVYLMISPYYPWHA